MSKIHDSYLDLLLTGIANDTVNVHFCSAQPADYAGIAAVSLGSTTDFTIGAKKNGDTSGRAIPVTVNTGTMSSTGTATHAVLDNNVDTLIVAVALSTSKAYDATDGFNSNEFDIGVSDPA